MTYSTIIGTLSSIGPLALFFLLRQYNLDQPLVLDYLRKGFIASSLLYFLILFIIYLRIVRSAKGQETLMVSKADLNPPGILEKFFPKLADPALQIKKPMTLNSYETSLLASNLKSSAFSTAISLFFHYKFKINQTLVMQPVINFLKLLEFPLFRIYLLGHDEQKYKELVRPFPEKDFTGIMKNTEETPRVEVIDENN